MVTVAINGISMPVDPSTDMGGHLHIGGDGSFLGEAVVRLGGDLGHKVQLSETIELAVQVKGVETGVIVLAYAGLRGYCGVSG